MMKKTFSYNILNILSDILFDILLNIFLIVLLNILLCILLNIWFDILLNIVFDILLNILLSASDRFNKDDILLNAEKPVAVNLWQIFCLIFYISKSININFTFDVGRPGPQCVTSSFSLQSLADSTLNQVEVLNKC